MTNKEIFNQNMDELADAINEKAQTYGKKTVTEMTSTVKDIHIGAVDSVNGRIGDVVLDKSDVNLGNVDNTSDLDKPVSTATQVELGKKQNTLTAGAGISITEEGIISADTGIKVQVVETLPATGDTKTIYLKSAEEAETDNVYDEYIYVNNAWEKIGTTEIDLSGYVQKTTTIAGISLENNIAGTQLKAALELAKTDVGLGNVDNTADLDKPVSTATQTALDGKLSLSGGTMSGSIFSNATQIIKGGENNVIGQSAITSSVFVGDINRNGNLSLITGTPYKIVHETPAGAYEVLDAANTSANPTLAGTEETLTGLKLNGTTYKIPMGATVKKDIDLTEEEIDELFYSASEYSLIQQNGVGYCNQLHVDLIYNNTSNSWNFRVGNHALTNDQMIAACNVLLYRPWVFSIDNIHFSDGNHPTISGNGSTIKRSFELDPSTGNANGAFYIECTETNFTGGLGVSKGVYKISAVIENFTSSDPQVTITSVKKIDGFDYVVDNEGYYNITNLTVNECYDFIKNYGPLHSADALTTIYSASREAAEDGYYYRFAGVTNENGEGAVFSCGGYDNQALRFVVPTILNTQNSSANETLYGDEPVLSSLKLNNVNYALPVSPVSSVNEQTGAVVLTKSDLGLGNVDNTADADKPISTATQTALDGKLNNTNPVILSSDNQYYNIYFGGISQSSSRIQYIYSNTSRQFSIYFSCPTHSQAVSLLHAGADQYGRGGVQVGNGYLSLTLIPKSGESIQRGQLGTSVTVNMLDALNTSANPTLSGSETTLTALKLDGVSYKIPTFDPTSITGYDASKSQILTHDAQGVMTWVDATTAQSGSEVTLP